VTLRLGRFPTKTKWLLPHTHDPINLTRLLRYENHVDVAFVSQQASLLGGVSEVYALAWTILNTGSTVLAKLNMGYVRPLIEFLEYTISTRPDTIATTCAAHVVNHYRDPLHQSDTTLCRF
jgi:hypothetical protein